MAWRDRDDAAFGRLERPLPYMDFRTNSGLSDFRLYCTDGVLFVNKHIVSAIPVLEASLRFETSSYDIGVSMEAGKLVILWTLKNCGSSFKKIISFGSYSTKDLWEAMNLAHMLCMPGLVTALDAEISLQLDDVSASVINTIFAKNFQRCKAWVLSNFSNLDLTGVDDSIAESLSDKDLQTYLKYNTLPFDRLRECLRDRWLGTVLRCIELSKLSPEDATELFFSVPVKTYAFMENHTF